MLELSLDFSSDLVNFASVDLVETFAKYLNTLSVAPTP